MLDRERRGLREVMSRPVMVAPHTMLESREEGLAALLHRARRCVGHRLDRAEDDLEHTRARVVALSPAATLERGYAVLQRDDGSVVRKPDEVAGGEELRARVAEGDFGVTVTVTPGE
jgi:exodeoxyribonuclease VII large subunit